MTSSTGQWALRLAAIAIIWGFGTGMLAIAIPLVSITHSDALPLAIILALTVGTWGIWRVGAGPSLPLPTESLKNLETRISHLEAIYDPDEADLHQRFQQLEAKDYTES